MPRVKKSDVPLSKSEVRHLKQKEKLEIDKIKNVNTITYTPVKNFKVAAYEEAQKQGFNCFLSIDSILMFNENDYEKINSWLKEYFGTDEIPMSYGFSGNTIKGENNEQTDTSR